MGRYLMLLVDFVDCLLIVVDCLLIFERSTSYSILVGQAGVSSFACLLFFVDYQVR